MAQSVAGIRVGEATRSPGVVQEPRALAQSVLATLSYHDLLDVPLTAVEAWRYVLRPRGSGQGAVGSGHGVPTLREIENTLASLVSAGGVETQHGFFFFPGRTHLVEERIEKHTRSMLKWRRLRRIVFWLQAVPFLRGVAGTGSLAFNNTKEASDLDVLIIAAPNRVWTVRFLLTVLLDALRLRRRPQGPTKHRICLNHYLSLETLEFPYRSLYTALEYARLVPLLGADACWAFRAANRSWIEEYLVRIFPDVLPHQHTVRSSRILRLVQRAAEAPLRGRLGDVLERVLARAQRARIARADAVTAPGRIVATDVRAEFHPQSREAPLLSAFNERMGALGLAESFGQQQDSGLMP